MRESEKRVEYSILQSVLMSKEALSLHIQNQQFFSAHNTQKSFKKKSKEKNFLHGFCAHKKREKRPRGSGSLGSVVSLSRCFLRRFLLFAREQTPNHHRERNEKIMVEVIEILDSDEEGDERVRIVQQNFEPRLRPIREEEGNDNTNSNNNNRDEDVVITGARRFLSVFPPLLPFFLGELSESRQKGCLYLNAKKTRRKMYSIPSSSDSFFHVVVVFVFE